VFEPFEQLEGPRAKHTPGLGLGLGLVQQLVRGLGGAVTLASTPGVGSTFTVTLPADVGSAAAPVRCDADGG
jgi:signal transduction histidine kinase